MKDLPSGSAVIQPEDIRRKAETLYAGFLQAWLEGDNNFFPYTIRGRRTPGEEQLATAIQAIQRLRDGSKESRALAIPSNGAKSTLEVRPQPVSSQDLL